MNRIITNANWIKTWLKNRKDWSGHDFAIVCAGAGYPSEDLASTLDAASRMRDAGAKCILGHGHHRAETFHEAWFDKDFWTMPMKQLWAIWDIGGVKGTPTEVIIDLEPYRVTSHPRYPYHLYDEAWRVSEAMGEYIQALRMFDAVYFEQANHQNILTHLLKIRGVNVVAVPTGCKKWPYGECGRKEWDALATQWTDDSIEAEPFILAKSVCDAEGMAELRAELDKMGNWWTYFAGNNVDLPGFSGGSRENYAKFGTDEFSDAWAKAGDQVK